MTPKKRGRTSFASFAEDASIASLPTYDEQAPTSALLDELAHNPHNPREGYADAAIAELAESLRETGQLQPATVVARDVFLAHYPDAAEAVGPARWVVVTGNRRLAAARRAGLDRLDIVVRDQLGGQDPRLSEATLIENVQREALPPLLEAREVQVLVEKYGSQDEVARRVSKSSGWVSQRVALLALPGALQDALRAGDLTIRDARELNTLEKQVRKLAELRGEEVPVEQARPAAPTSTRPRRGRPPKSIEKVAEELRRKHSPDDLARLVELLTDS